MGKHLLMCAVHESDLDDVLKKAGVYDAFIAGEKACRVCGQPVARETLHAFVRRDGKLALCCNAAECQAWIADHSSGELRNGSQD